MTVSLIDAEVKLLGNGSTTEWSLGFELPDENYLEVQLWSSGTGTLLTLNTDYRVTGLGNELGATLTYPISGSPVADGDFLYIRRVMPLTQNTTSGPDNRLSAAEVAAQFDTIAMQIQELQAIAARTLQMATEATTPFAPVSNGIFGTDNLGRPKIITDYTGSLTTVSGAIVWEAITVTDLINDTDLGYTGAASVQVTTGDLLRAGGYRYRVEDATASSYDLETAGGVRVSVLDPASDAFGLLGSGFGAFFNLAKTIGYGLISAGTYVLPSTTLAGINGLTLRGVAKSVLSKMAGTANLLNFISPQKLTFEDVQLQGNYLSLGLSGHGLSLRDADDTTIDNIKATDFGGLTADNGGAAVLAYPNDGTTPLERNIYSRLRLTGAVSQKAFGAVLASAKYNILYGSIAHDMSNWGLEFKNNSVHNVMGLSVGYSCRYSFGTGYEGAVFAEHNMFGLLVSQDSDIAFMWSNAKNNVLMGLNADAEAQPDTFGDGKVYGLHIEQGSDENLAMGVLTSGAIMDYPTRVRGVRNAVFLADYSDAAKSITVETTGTENYFNLIHVGGKATDVRQVISDLNGTKVGSGANVYDSPTTRQYYGSVGDSFTWGLDGLANSYLWGSFPDFRFEGNAGETVLGLGVKSGLQAGLVVTTDTAAAEARLVYQFDATPYWRMDVDETQVLRVDTTAISPVADATINLGKDTVRFNNAYFVNYKFQPPTSLGYTLSNGEVTITRPSNTQLRFHVKGSDGIIRTATLTLS